MQDMILHVPCVSLEAVSREGLECCVCKSGAQPLASCSTFVLSTSSLHFRAKFRELTADSHDFVDEPTSHELYSCIPCLNLVVSIDFLEVELDKRLSCFHQLRLGPKEETLVDVCLVEGNGPSPTEPVDSLAIEPEDEEAVEKKEIPLIRSSTRTLRAVKREGRTNEEFYSEAFSSSESEESDADDEDFHVEHDDPLFENAKLNLPEGDEPSVQPVKRPRGRPRGSATTPKIIPRVEPKQRRKRGRRPKSLGPNPNPPRTQTPSQFVSKRSSTVGFLQWFRPSVCRLCGKDFGENGLETRLEHHQKAHLGEPPFSCHFCSVGFTRMNPFSCHVMTEELSRSLGGSFSCRICAEDLVNPRRLENHFKVNHPDERRVFVCDRCGEGFGSYDELIEHGQRKPVVKVIDSDEKDGDETTVESLTCPRCGNGFSSTRRLEYHYVMCEFSLKRYCDECGIFYKHGHQLDQHMNQVHLKAKPHVCQLCGKGFDSKMNWYSHMEYHRGSEEPKICPICGKSIRRFMKHHIAEVHSGELAHKCDMCEEAFNFRVTLMRHKATVHNYKGQHKFVQHGIRDAKLTIHTCHVCGKEFGKHDRLKRHMLTHDGIKPHQCPHCDHRTSDFVNLKTHMRLRHQRNVKRVFRQGGGETDYDIVDISPGGG